MNRYKPFGWRYESYRHSLAAKGIRTSFSKYFRKTVLPEKNISFPDEPMRRMVKRGAVDLFPLTSSEKKIVSEEFRKHPEILELAGRPIAVMKVKSPIDIAKAEGNVLSVDTLGVRGALFTPANSPESILIFPQRSFTHRLVFNEEKEPGIPAILAHEMHHAHEIEQKDEKYGVSGWGKEDIDDSDHELGATLYEKSVVERRAQKISEEEKNKKIREVMEGLK